jgi:hypothetical protein
VETNDSFWIKAIGWIVTAAVFIGFKMLFENIDTALFWGAILMVAVLIFGTIIINKLASKIALPYNAPMIFPFSLQAAYAVAVFVSALIIIGDTLTVIEALIFMLFLIWLYLRPGLLPVIFITIYHVISVIIFLTLLINAIEYGYLGEVAFIIVFHTAVKCLSIWLMFSRLKVMKQLSVSEKAQTAN